MTKKWAVYHEHVINEYLIAEEKFESEEEFKKEYPDYTLIKLMTDDELEKYIND